MNKNKTTILIILASLLALNLSSLNAKDRSLKKEASKTEDVLVLPSFTEQEEYKISPFDLISISVYQEDDLNKTVKVSRDGYITYPLIGKVKVSGLTVIKAEKRIAALLRKDYLVNPHVTVFIKSYQSKKIFVLGEVKKPGSYDIPQDRDLTVLEAIIMAGGFTEVAARDKTKVIRVEDGEQEYIEVKIDDIIRKGDKTKDVILKAKDTIYVPQRLF